MPLRAYTCPTCNKTFESTYSKVYCSDKCRYDKRNYDENGKFIKRPAEIKKTREKIKKEFGYTELKNPRDFIQETNEKLQNAGLMKANEVRDFGKFTKDFYAYLGFGTPHSYYWAIDKKIQVKVNDMQSRHKGGIRLDSGEVFSPIDDMYGTPEEGDTWYEYGRIPTSHLVALCMARLGAANAVCSRPATDMFDNDFEFVKRTDPNGDPVNDDKVKDVKNWMDKVRFHKRLAESVEFTEQTGNGYLIADKFLGKKEKSEDWKTQKPNSRPMGFKTFSAYHMTPVNVWQEDTLDYEKQDWVFRGGVHTSAEIHPSRTFVFSLRRYPYQLRDLALPETCFVSFLCLLNASYSILKAIGQLGTVTIGVQTESIYPTAKEVNNYLEYLNAMKMNNFYVLGKGATMQVENAAGKIGQGIPQLLEYFKEDICASTVFPKNELFGRSDGGGLSGAGALVSKETYLNSNISVKFGMVKRDISWILQNMCNFKGLEDLTPKLNIDLHKTESQRLMEALQRQELKQQEVITDQVELGNKLYKRQIELQVEMLKVQKEMFDENPREFMEQSQLDEENTSDKDVNKTDFINHKSKTLNNLLRFRLLQCQKEYDHNSKVLDMLRGDTNNLRKIQAKENFAYRKYIEREKKVERRGNE